MGLVRLCADPRSLGPERQGCIQQGVAEGVVLQGMAKIFGFSGLGLELRGFKGLRV